MLWLGIETATDEASATLRRGETVVAEHSFPPDQRLCARLAPTLKVMLVSAGADWSDLGGIAVDIGPGRFTSLRIGVATAKALAWQSGCPLVGVNSLEVLAEDAGARGETSILALLKAPREQFFAAGYRQEAGLREVFGPRLLPPTELAGVLAELPAPRVVVGATRGLASGPADIAPPSPPRAAALLRRAQAHLAQGAPTDPLSLDPFYLAAPGVTLPTPAASKPAR